MFYKLLSFQSENEVPDDYFQNNAENKIFVVGMTRSGTSLIEQILSSHNKLLIKKYCNKIVKLEKGNLVEFK